VCVCVHLGNRSEIRELSMRGMCHENLSSLVSGGPILAMKYAGSDVSFFVRWC
jgi:hypothetical protein